MDYFDKDGNKIKEELFTAEDVEEKTNEAVEEKIKEAEEKHTAKITEMKEAHTQQLARKTGTKEEKAEALQKEMDDLKKTTEEKNKAFLESAINRKLDKLSGGNEELKEMLIIQSKKFKDIENIDDVDEVFDNAMVVLGADEKGKGLLDNVAEASTRSMEGTKIDAENKVSEESLKTFGNTQEDVDKYLNKKE